MPEKNSSKLPKVIIILFFIGLIVRLCFVFVSKSYIAPRAFEYGEIARNIAIGKGFARVDEFSGKLEITSSHAPLHPYFLSIFFSLGQKDYLFFLIQLIQAFLSSLTILIFYRIALLVFNKFVAILTSIGISLYPPLIYYCAKLTPTSFFVFFLSLTILLILHQRKNVLKYIAAGFTLGLSILCNPLAFAIFPALIIWYVIFKKISFNNMGLVIITSLIVLSPWTIRNFSIHHHIVPVTTQFGKNFWIGNNINATGTDYYAVNPNDKEDYVFVTSTLPRSIKNDLGRKSEIERAKFFLKEGMEFVKAEPIHFISLLVKKFYYYWWFAPPTINASVDTDRYKILYVIFYIPVLILGFIGIIISLNRSHVIKTLLIILVLIFISGTYILAHPGLIRYRIPVEIFLIMFAGFSIYKLKEIIPRKP